nr:lipoprotein insertase outer membrane protein LolB [Mesocricetibacter intestinalis]
MLFVIPLLNGCVLSDISDQRPTEVITIDKSDPQWQQHLSRIKAIGHYQNQGQIGYISAKERFSSRFEWQYQGPQNYRLKLYSTVSSTSLMLQRHQSGLTLTDNKGNRRSERDAKLLVREIIGTDIPLEHLAQWLKGQPDENSNYQVGENHYLAGFSYNAEGALWTADYLNYHTQLTPALPKDILLKHSDQTLKIRVDNWTF